MKKRGIIDFHTHPFLTETQNICNHPEIGRMSLDSSLALFDRLGIDAFCGSVISLDPWKGRWEQIAELNRAALKIAALTDRFVPGYHVHPAFVRESVAEIERMSALGVRLIGELVPYFHGWNDYADVRFFEILEAAEHFGAVVSFHSIEEKEDRMDAMVRRFPRLCFVAAHPGERGAFLRHMARMDMSENYHLDLSGYGLFRHGMLRHALDLFGRERILFGSDYPTCNPAMYIGGVELDPLITEEEKEAIFYGNAARILRLPKPEGSPLPDAKNA